MEISGPLNDLRINDNPDNWIIEDRGISDRWEKRWKALRRDVRDYPVEAYIHAGDLRKRMTKITRKIK